MNEGRTHHDRHAGSLPAAPGGGLVQPASASPTPTRDAPPAALLEHLARERAWLEAARETMLAVRRGIATGDLPALELAARKQADLAAVQDELAAQRRQVLALTAQELGLGPHPVPLAALTARMGTGARTSVAALRRELSGEARSLRVLTASTLEALCRSRRLVDDVLALLTGVGTDESRYTAAGGRQSPAATALVECRT